MKILILAAMIVSSTTFAVEHISCEYNYGMGAYATGNIRKLDQIHKNFKVNGLRYEVHIENTSKYSELDDFIIVESEEGRKIIYPLECQ